MKELVGICHICKKDVYCLDGFLNGIIDDEGQLTCLACTEDYVYRNGNLCIIANINDK